MFIEHFCGKIQVDDINEIDRIFRIKAEGDVNEFWISNNSDYPCMCVSTNQELAHVHYFFEEDNPGFQAIGNLNNDNDCIVFYTNSIHEKIEKESDYVIDLNSAIELVKEFFVTNELPQSIEWDEL